MEHFRKITDFVSILTLDLEVNFDFHSVLIISFFFQVKTTLMRTKILSWKYEKIEKLDKKLSKEIFEI